MGNGKEILGAGSPKISFHSELGVVNPPYPSRSEFLEYP
ncbi:MAG: hypothetical protein CLLPBCKN_000607 [Chroococcidiopsis cubana SAG 39.79]|uniref:Uncharacterized protein n=1 Tax=Chroococcidiopsis thermalis (strain PCC 7203) TaxID=251229 RepID=K9U1G1_CHRTP|nr:hypothetical protein Chro_3469 [Chroococcidiopsis thermalis PCC 7203]MDZ4871219.1 hypothetical protein [Chroococcidiopsis cubana SAG 39.79]